MILYAHHRPRHSHLNPPGKQPCSILGVLCPDDLAFEPASFSTACNRGLITQPPPSSSKGLWLRLGTFRCLSRLSEEAIFPSTQTGAPVVCSKETRAAGSQPRPIGHTSEREGPLALNMSYRPVARRTGGRRCTDRVMQAGPARRTSPDPGFGSVLEPGLGAAAP